MITVLISVQICSRDEATLRRRSFSLTYRKHKRGLFSSLKGLDNLTKRGREKRAPSSQVSTDVQPDFDIIKNAGIPQRRNPVHNKILVTGALNQKL